MDLKVNHFMLTKLTLTVLCVAASGIGIIDGKEIFHQGDRHEAVKLTGERERNSVESVEELQQRLKHIEIQIEYMLARDEEQNKLISDLTRKVDSFGTYVERHQHCANLHGEGHKEAEIIPNDSKFELSDSKVYTNNMGTNRPVRLTEDEPGTNSRDNVRHADQSPKLLRRSRRAVGGVAFSVYLTQTNSHMMPGQPIKFDHVLVNDGLGYNPYTGSFTVPLTGTYLFTFHFDSRENTFVRLVVNGVNENDAVANPHINAPHGENESMGGNTAIVHVHKGDAVLVETYETNDSEVASSNKFRLSSFSGVLLY